MRLQTSTLAAAALEPLCERFEGQAALIFASGPSLPSLWDAERPIPLPSIAINDAWRLAPGADILYASDVAWWRFHQGVPEFVGLKVGCHECWQVRGIVNIELSGPTGYDERLGWIRYGSNSGYAAIHLAAQLGATKIVLVGFDMRTVNGKSHWFGEHDRLINRRRGSPYTEWFPAFAELGEQLAPRGVEILNATPGSALECFPPIRLEDVVV